MKQIKAKDIRITDDIAFIDAPGNALKKFGSDKMCIKTDNKVYVLPVSRFCAVIEMTLDEFKEEYKYFKEQLEEKIQSANQESEDINGLGW